MVLSQARTSAPGNPLLKLVAGETKPERKALSEALRAPLLFRRWRSAQPPSRAVVEVAIHAN
ncbi:hypothetical protein BDW22DRAFT_1361200 [Trametopsis cervina]|nr:hypothetical protein BDW22DRAFT_1361200 [Trametopsis cervina]